MPVSVDYEHEHRCAEHEYEYEWQLLLLLSPQGGARNQFGRACYRPGFRSVP